MAPGEDVTRMGLSGLERRALGVADLLEPRGLGVAGRSMPGAVGEGTSRAERLDIGAMGE